jgi:hypothetical protein
MSNLIHLSIFQFHSKLYTIVNSLGLGINGHELSVQLTVTSYATKSLGCQSGAVVRSMFEINISACHH